MYKPHYFTVAILLLVVTLVSCDENASKRQGFEGWNQYKGVIRLSLYAPNWEIENTDATQAGTLCTDLFPAQFLINVSKDETAVITCNEMNGVHFNMPYLDENYEVRPIFRQGTFSGFYDKLKNAAEKGLIDPLRFKQFQKDISTLNDTLFVSSIETGSLPLIVRGASLTTWDEVQKSPYVRFSVKDTQIKRRSSIFTALHKIQDLLKQMYDQKLINAEEYEELRNIHEEESMTMTDGNGWMTSMYVNLHADFDMNLEQATGLLDYISSILFGTDEQGNLHQPLWLVISFYGDTVWEKE